MKEMVCYSDENHLFFYHTQQLELSKIPHNTIPLLHCFQNCLVVLQ